MRNIRICDLINCERKHFGKGLCVLHYHRQRFGRTLEEPIKHQYKHNLRNHKLYNTWLKMRDRCNNPNHKYYKNYGGRGIKVCKRWDNFALFVVDMGERPENYTLDRINNEGDYEPSNCKWSSRKEQQANRRKVG